MAHTQTCKNAHTKMAPLQKYRDHIPCSFAYKVVCVDNKFSKKVVLYSEKNVVYRFIKAILEEYDYCKKNDKETF